MRQGLRLAALLIGLGLVVGTSAPARADWVVHFRYDGRGGPDFAGLIATGTGSFRFADGLTSIGLADLTDFTFSLEETTPNTTQFELADLTSFSAVVGPGFTVSSLGLATSAVQGDNPTTERREFDVSALTSMSASSSYVLLGFSFEMTQGTVTITSVVPEPTGFVLGTIGVLLFGANWWRARVHAPRKSAIPRS